MTATVGSHLNQVDLAAVGALVQAVSEQPEKAATTWAAQVRWTGAFKSEATVRDFAPMPSDEPKGMGGGDAAPNPVEQLLVALGNCLAVGYAANATVAGIEIQELTIKVEGDIDMHSFLGLKEGHAGFSGIRTVVDLKADADPAAIEALHRRVEGSSPVGHSIAAAVPITFTAT
ncbi:OsmC family protein [Sporichthya sp.]|uniref:OsmC family protein n=1 Tax=Sporichthya sp. TaxID=65475 RepID=UPI0017BC61E2|nr:OsmC family protein [Sporichthya sp.]MBA3744080.1 OsmC family protein [Sporichthya sp.]